MSDAKNRIVDRSKIIIPEGTMEDFKRPNHLDFMTASELKAAKFSGLRHNSLTDDAEIWILGDLTRLITKAEVMQNPHAINQAMEEVFALHKVLPDIPELRQMELDKIKKEH